MMKRKNKPEGTSSCNSSWLDNSGAQSLRRNLDDKFSFDFGAILLSLNSCGTHLLDNGVYQLTGHLLPIDET
ncbi:hypothetical protein ACTXT7_001099 [Hymenolepis weldensis]